MTDEISHEPGLPKNKGGRPKVDSITLTKSARARFDTLAAESIEAVFQAVLTAAAQDGDMAAAKLLIDRVIPSRRGAPVSFHIRPLTTPHDCALPYADKAQLASRSFGLPTEQVTRISRTPAWTLRSAPMPRSNHKRHRSGR